MEYTQREMLKLELVKSQKIDYCSIIWGRQLTFKNDLSLNIPAKSLVTANFRVLTVLDVWYQRQTDQSITHSWGSSIG